MILIIGSTFLEKGRSLFICNAVKSLVLTSTAGKQVSKQSTVLSPCQLTLHPAPNNSLWGKSVLLYTHSKLLGMCFIQENYITLHMHPVKGTLLTWDFNTDSREPQNPAIWSQQEESWFWNECNPFKQRFNRAVRMEAFDTHPVGDSATITTASSLIRLITI